MSPGARIDYKTLRQINPEAARKAGYWNISRQMVEIKLMQPKYLGLIGQWCMIFSRKQEKEIFKIGPKYPNTSQTKHPLRLIDPQIMAAISVSRPTVERIRKRFVEGGLERRNE